MAYRWDLWAAAFVINGGASEDGFEYFRGWLIAQGEGLYQIALRYPDNLADYVEPDFDQAKCEELLYVAQKAYEDKTGTKMPEQQKLFPEIVGQRWENEDELDALLARLSAKMALSE